MAADIDPTHPGVEMWSGDSQGIRNVKGEIIAPKMRNMPTNMAVWWDGDLLRELLDRNMIIKYDWENKKFVPLVKFTGTLFNNGGKKYSYAPRTTLLSGSTFRLFRPNTDSTPSLKNRYTESVSLPKM